MDVLTRKAAVQPGPALLPLKLVPPTTRGEVLLRPDLQALLAEVRLQPVTLVHAPAGYGKTTLLSQWAEDLVRTGATVAWISLDAEDQSPALLLAYLVRAFQSQLSHVGEQAWRVLHSAADLGRDWPLVAGALFSNLQQTLNTPTFLILDDYHLIADGPISAALLAYLLRAAPPSLHIIVSSRRPLSMPPLPRLRAEGLVLDVNQSMLSLTIDEARALLERYQVSLAPDELDLLLRRTEGWALSIQLAARALARQRPEQYGTYLATLDTKQQGLFDYLASEVLADLPRDLIDFMARAAIAEQFDAGLLAEALDEPQAARLIGRIRQMGLPLTPIDEGEAGEAHSAFRFHPLWRRLLLEQLQRLTPAEMREQLQRRFGEGFARRGNLETALSHFAAIDDDAAIARALREYAWPLINTPRRDSIRSWLEQLPTELRDSDPELLHMWGWSLAAAQPAQAVAAISQAAELYSSGGAYGRELRALSDLAALLFWDDRPLDFSVVAVRSIRAANRVRDDYARGTALVSVVAMLYTQGRFGAALRVARQAAKHPRNSFWDWLLALIVSTIHLEQGHANAARAVLDDALAAAQIDRDDRLRQNLLRQQAQVLFQQGHFHEATDLALSAHRRLSDYHTEGVLGNSAALLALLLLEQGRLEEANTYLGRARTSANRSGADTLINRIHIIESILLLRSGQIGSAVEAAQAIVRRNRLAPLDGDVSAYTIEPGRASLLTHDLWLQLLLVITLGEGGLTQQAARLADSVIAEMSGRGDGLFLALTYLYRAAIARQQHETQVATNALQAGWALLDRLGASYLPLLPSAIVSDSVVAALTIGIYPEAVSAVLRRQLTDQATAILLALLDKQNAPDARATIIGLLGELGTSSAFPVLRSMLKDRNPAVRTAAEHALERLVYRPSYTLRIRTLGAFGVWRGDVEIKDRDWRSVKARQLLQLLIVERGRMLPRDRIMDMLWPGLEMEAAANNLRVTLSRLTKAIEPQRPEGAPTYYIAQQGDTYGFNSESDHELDAATFSNAVAVARQALANGRRNDALIAYQRAIELYAGQFLPDCLYEDWSVVERERLALLFNEASLKLGELLLEDGAAHEAIGLAWRVLEHDQAQEEAYRLLMRAYAHLGERSTALRLYARCIAALESELGVGPMPETVELYEALRKQ